MTLKVQRCRKQLAAGLQSGRSRDYHASHLGISCRVLLYIAIPDTAEVTKKDGTKKPGILGGEWRWGYLRLPHFASQ